MAPHIASVTQDPNHMSKADYQQRQRKTDSISSLNALGRNSKNDEVDSSTLGFSLGSVQSAPALIGQGLGVDRNQNSGVGNGVGRGSRNARAATAGIGSSGTRGHSFTAFDNIDPLDGGVRVPRASPLSIPHDEGVGVPAALSPLSMSVSEGGAPAWGGSGAARPEYAGGDKDDNDPHLRLVKVRCYGVANFRP